MQKRKKKNLVHEDQKTLYFEHLKKCMNTPSILNYVSFFQKKNILINDTFFIIKINIINRFFNNRVKLKRNT